MRARVHLYQIVLHLLLAVAAVVMAAPPASAQDTIKLGLVAAMSGQSAKSGEAIVRGLSIAIDEINAKGGVLGKKLELVVRDDESNPAKGAVAARELVQREKITALFGGLDTPVSLAIVPFANQSKVPFVGVWAAGTPITRNGAAENYVFRVSAVDELVDVALVDYSVAKYQVKKPGMILINNPWGESNEKGLKAALAAKNIPYAGIEKFETNDVDVVPQLSRLKEAGADVLYLVANVAPSSQVVKSLDRMGWNVPIVSHWGPAGGRFSELAGPSAAKVHFIQTYSFSGKLLPKGETVLAALKKKISRDQNAGRRDAGRRHRQCLRRHAPDGAGDRQGRLVGGPEIREAFYAIDKYVGLIRAIGRSPRKTRTRWAQRLVLFALRRGCDPAAHAVVAPSSGRGAAPAAPFHSVQTDTQTGAEHSHHLGHSERAGAGRHVRPDRAWLPYDLCGVEHGQLLPGQLGDAGRRAGVYLCGSPGFATANRMRRCYLACAVFGLVVSKSRSPVCIPQMDAW